MVSLVGPRDLLKERGVSSTSRFPASRRGFGVNSLEIFSAAELDPVQSEHGAAGKAIGIGKRAALGFSGQKYFRKSGQVGVFANCFLGLRKCTLKGANGFPLLTRTSNVYRRRKSEAFFSPLRPQS